MRLAELSTATGVSTATLKYYLREGLLMPGTPTSATRSTYAPAHVDRVRLVRALLEIGGLSIADVRGVLTALDNPPDSVSELLGYAHSALPGPGSASGSASGSTSAPAERADSRVTELLAALGWAVYPDSPARAGLSRALHAAAAAGVPVTDERLRRYARACQDIAGIDLDYVASDAQDTTDMLRIVVVGTVMVDPVLVALRRLAQEAVSREVLG